MHQLGIFRRRCATFSLGLRCHSGQLCSLTFRHEGCQKAFLPFLTCQRSVQISFFKKHQNLTFSACHFLCCPKAAKLSLLAHSRASFQKPHFHSNELGRGLFLKWLQTCEMAKPVQKEDVSTCHELRRTCGHLGYLSYPQNLEQEQSDS